MYTRPTMPQLLESILDQVRPATLLDIAITALLIYWLFSLIRGTRAVSLVVGVTVLFVVYAIANAIDLRLLTQIMETGAFVGVFALVVVFQPELRRALEQLGHTGSRFNLPFVTVDHPHPGLAAVDEIVNAASALGRQRIGALIVIERETGLDAYVDKGVVLEALLTRQLLINIFFKNSPLHDGAVIVRGDRIVAARCIMPLSEEELPGQFGTRHRAALGISEESDAVAVIVSEQSGGISVAHDGQIDRDMTSERLRQELVDLVVYDEPSPNGRLVGRFRPFRS